LNLLNEGDKFEGFSDLGLVNLRIDSPEWNDLTLDNIRLRIRAGKLGIQYDNAIWKKSLNEIEEKIQAVKLQRSFDRQGPRNKSGKR
jgi:hypothetical protein